jgi:hypothetical protein
MVTAEQLQAARRNTGEEVEANWGRVTLALGADGRFEFLNDRYPGGPIGYGTWASRGDVLTLSAGGDFRSGAGERWRYRWTLFRGALALKKLPSDVPPTSLTVAPLSQR